MACCEDCLKIFKRGETVYELSTGTFDGEDVSTEESLEVWCESCEVERSKRRAG